MVGGKSPTILTLRGTIYVTQSFLNLIIWFSLPFSTHSSLRCNNPLKLFDDFTILLTVRSNWMEVSSVNASIIWLIIVFKCSCSAVFVPLMSLCTADVSPDLTWIKLFSTAGLPLSQSVCGHKGGGGTPQRSTLGKQMGKVVLLITESPSKEQS